MLLGGGAVVILLLTGVLGGDRTQETLETTREAQELLVREQDFPFEVSESGVETIDTDDFEDLTGDLYFPFHQDTVGFDLDALREDLEDADVEDADACLQPWMDLEDHEELNAFLRTEPEVGVYRYADADREAGPYAADVMLLSYTEPVNALGYLRPAYEACADMTWQLQSPSGSAAEIRLSHIDHHGFEGQSLLMTSEGQPDHYTAVVLKEHGNNLLEVYYTGPGEQELFELLDAQNERLEAGLD
ncbi:hypothetical protein GCM10009771_20260 [Nesterenkonia flava]